MKRLMVALEVLGTTRASGEALMNVRKRQESSAVREAATSVNPKPALAARLFWPALLLSVAATTLVIGVWTTGQKPPTESPLPLKPVLEVKAELGAKTEATETATPVAPDPKPASAPAVFPTFAQPEQAEAYRAAVVQGNKRALSQLRQALTNLEQDEDADPSLVARLKAQISEREERIAVSTIGN